MQMHVLFIHVMSYNMNYCGKIFLLAGLLTLFLQLTFSMFFTEQLNLSNTKFMKDEILHLMTSYESVGVNYHYLSLL